MSTPSPKSHMLELMERAARHEPRDGVVAWDEPPPKPSTSSAQWAGLVLGALPGERPEDAIRRRDRIALMLDRLVASERRQSHHDKVG